MRIQIFLIVSILSLSNWCTAQSTASILEMADLQFANQVYNEALDNYLKIIKEKPNNDDLKYKIGICYLHLGQVQTGEQYLLHTANTKNAENKVYYYLGRSSHLKGAYKDAISYYKKFIKNSKNKRFKAWAKHYILQCDAAQTIQYQDELAIVDNMGMKVNSFLDDYAPIISPGRQNTVYFSSEREGNSGGKRDIEGLKNGIIGQYKSDIYSTQLLNGEWTSTNAMNNLINSTKNDEVIGFSDDASVLYYYKGNISTLDGAIYTDTLKNTDEVVFPQTYKSPVKVKQGDETPQIFNRDIIIYASRQEGGYGGLDLYITMRIPGGFWTRPENLGPSINTPFDEKCPFLAKNGRTLYYSSNGRNSMGGFDIFRSTFRDDRLEWTESQNLGLPINSPADDLYFSLAKDGLKCYLSSNRPNGSGGADIYVGYFKSVQSEQLRASNPIAFNMIKEQETITNPGTNPNPTPQTPIESEASNISVIFKPMFYSGDKVVNNANKAELNKIIRLAGKNPQLMIELSGHTDDSDPEKFRLYFSYLKAQKAADYLTKNGVDKNRILVKGLGSNYSVARNKNYDGSTNNKGQELNRRIEIRLLNTSIKQRLEWPIINNSIKLDNRKIYDNSLKGLSYKIQVAALSSMYDSDIVLKYSDTMVEHDPQRNLRKYTVGLPRHFSNAKQLRDDLKRQGVSGAFVVPYINGVRIDPSTAESYKAQYPDLANFLRG